MIGHWAFVVCDRCKRSGPPAIDAAQARALAYRDGWERRNWNVRLKDICPDCQDRTQRIENRHA